MQLRINITWARIGLNQTLPRLKTHTHLPLLRLQTRLPEVQIRQEQPRISIDHSHVRAELGFRDHRRFAAYWARRGHEQAAEGTARTAREGDRLARIEAGGNAIADIARENFTDSAEVNITPWPTCPPRITFSSGRLEITTRPGTVRADYAPAAVMGEFRWGGVEVYLLQKPGVEIEAVLDRRI